MMRWHENAGLRFGQNGIRSLAAIKPRSIVASENAVCSCDENAVSGCE
jgi:hypothetical protein